MKIGLSSAAFYGRLETDEAAAHLPTLPLDFCEIFLESFQEYSAAFGRQVQAGLKGLPCVSIHCKGTQFEPDLFGASRHQSEDAFRFLEGALDAAQILGAAYYVFHGPGTMHHDMHPLKILRLAERLPRILDLCRQHGITFLWENVSWCTLKTPEHVQALREAFPQLCFVLDLKQAMRCGQDPFAVLRAMGDRLRHLHVMDWTADGKLCLPGEGCFDFPRLKKELEALGYTGGVLLEPYADNARDEAALKRSLHYLHHIFA